ncbi:MAG: CopG family transcriptional regulator [Deltaproteobacteria bacterium]|nr:CopG family transcriptional regulator [Deltaproteobacteria bacterium]
MPSRQRAVMTISVPPLTAKEYRKIAGEQGESISQLFRDMFDLYKRQKLKEEFKGLQKYGAQRAKKLNLTEREIERLIFEGR